MSVMTGRIDSHLHLWDLDVSEYAWLTPSMGRLYSTFTPSEAGETLRVHEMEGAVLVQAEDSVVDTQFMLDVAAANPWVVGVVGWVALDNPAVVHSQLDRWREYPVFCGVRHLINDDPRGDLLDRTEVRESLRELTRHSLPFDVHDAWPRHLDQATRLATELPELLLVLDHLGKPPRHREGDNFARWSDAIGEFARRPNTVTKLSGLAREGYPLAREELMRTFDRVLDLFGPGRIMYGGDWPVAPDEYGVTLGVAEELISQLSPSEQRQIMRETAVEVYRLGR
ncbi:amidohydrolase family protein [Lysinibacter sp. HNR]|uniref:amidohydrolase family protein n=1 Tax=Lysinibacter sp. HNR TaxID=3031408 RepID=UPI0024360FEB|nr:amidohydrolase family protein [Lysinibacter sp. HNR]WGD37485.1 amidohydrolase family protein [Lysinibacter sp. HNR]